MELTITNGVLSCPMCGADTTHVDVAYIDGRTKEDGDHIGVIVNNGGSVNFAVAGLPEELQGDRRYAMSVGGFCEQHDGRFSIVFRQHKGATLVDVVVDHDAVDYEF